MPRRRFSGRETASVLVKHGFEPTSRVGSHLKLRYEGPENDVRIVTVPMTSADRIPEGTLRSIAEQSGADDFDAWCTWIADHC